MGCLGPSLCLLWPVAGQKVRQVQLPEVSVACVMAVHPGQPAVGLLVGDSSICVGPLAQDDITSKKQHTKR